MATDPVVPNVADATQNYVDPEGWQNIVLKFDLTPIAVAGPKRDDTQLIDPFFTDLALLAEPYYDTNT